jgi:hypothetical protein
MRAFRMDVKFSFGAIYSYSLSATEVVVINDQKAIQPECALWLIF